MTGMRGANSLLQAVAQRGALIGGLVLTTVLLLLFIRHWPFEPFLASDYYAFNAWSDRLLNAGFDYGEAFRRLGLPERLYTVPLTVMALLKLLFGELWRDVYVWLNMLWTALTLFAICSAARMLKVSWLAIAAVLPLVLLSADFMFWPQYVLTDTLFAFLLMAMVWWVVFVLTRVHPSRVQRVFFILVALLLLGLVLLGRPTSPTYVLAFVAFVLAVGVGVDRIRPRSLAVGIAGLIGLLALGYGVLISVYVNTDWISRSRELSFIARFAIEGLVVYDRPDTAIQHTGRWLDYAWLFIVRFLTFWSPYASTFSLEHLIANFTVKLAFLGAFVAWVVSGHWLDRPQSRAALLVVLIALAGSAFHATMFVDFDWRYRFPVIAPMLLLTMLMLDLVVRRWAETGLRRASAG